MPGPNPAQCKTGDVILFYGLNLVSFGEKAAKTLKILTVVPAVVSAAQTGSAGILGNASCNHAAIISRRTESMIAGRFAQFDMSHATGAHGIITEDIENWFIGGGGSCKVFRCKYQGAGEKAAEVALKWAPQKGSNDRKLPFGKGKAFLSALRSSRYGDGAKARAAFFRQHKNTEGGPPGLASGAAEMSMFCSMFVISVFQAAMPEEVTRGILALDSKFTSPMTLDGYFHSNQIWEEVNAVPPP